MKATKVKASLRNYRRSAKKVREIASVVRGIMVSEAEVRLSGISKQSSEDILKLIKSAVANAENNFKLDKKDLFISEIKVDEGPVMKRWRARAYGRAAQILKRSCHVNVVLESLKKDEIESSPDKVTAEKGKKEEKNSAKVSKKETSETVKKDNKKTSSSNKETAGREKEESKGASKKVKNSK